jgi:hypothetical protein
MKISIHHSKQNGSAVVVVIVLLAIVLIYVGGNVRTISSLEREIKLVERQQLRRLQTTNSPPSALPAPSPETSSIP